MVIRQRSPRDLLITLEKMGSREVETKWVGSRVFFSYLCVTLSELLNLPQPQFLICSKD